jgi:hypothetical protein
MNHQRILNAYLSRLTYADLENLVKHNLICLNAQLNGNNNAQLDAQAGFNAAVYGAIDNLSKHDQNLIENIINNELEREF